MADKHDFDPWPWITDAARGGEKKQEPAPEVAKAPKADKAPETAALKANLAPHMITADVAQLKANVATLTVASPPQAPPQESDKDTHTGLADTLRDVLGQRKGRGGSTKESDQKSPVRAFFSQAGALLPKELTQFLGHLKQIFGPVVGGLKASYHALRGAVPGRPAAAGGEDDGGGDRRQPLTDIANGLFAKIGDVLRGRRRRVFEEPERDEDEDDEKEKRPKGHGPRIPRPRRRGRRTEPETEEATTEPKTATEGESGGAAGGEEGAEAAAGAGEAGEAAEGAEAAAGVGEAAVAGEGLAALTGPAFAVTGALVAVVAGLALFAVGVTKAAESALEAERHFAEVSPSQAATFAQFDARSMQRDLKMGEETASSTSDLADSLSDLLDDTTGIQELFLDVKNYLLTDLVEIADQIIKPVGELADMVREWFGFTKNKDDKEHVIGLGEWAEGIANEARQERAEAARRRVDQMPRPAFPLNDFKGGGGAF
jgi:hypothetical protein